MSTNVHKQSFAELAFIPPTVMQTYVVAMILVAVVRCRDLAQEERYFLTIGGTQK
jgi:hypothetical protein